MRNGELILMCDNQTLMVHIENVRNTQENRLINFAEKGTTKKNEIKRRKKKRIARPKFDRAIYYDDGDDDCEATIENK